MSSLFLFVRVFATGVIVYSVSIVIELITGLSFVYSVLILGLITIVYDVLGDKSNNLQRYYSNDNFDCCTNLYSFLFNKYFLVVLDQCLIISQIKEM